MTRRQVVNKPANTWRFGVGISANQRGEFASTVTVKAKTLDWARNLAITECDRRCERSSQEPPVGWDLTLVEARHVPCLKSKKPLNEKANRS